MTRISKDCRRAQQYKKHPLQDWQDVNICTMCGYRGTRESQVNYKKGKPLDSQPLPSHCVDNMIRAPIQQAVLLITLHWHFMREHTQRKRQENSGVADTKSPSHTQSIPIFPSLGRFRGFAKAVHSAVQILPFGCWRRCWKQPNRLHCADWGTVEIAHSKVHGSGRGGIVVWASLYPCSMAQRKGWLVSLISKCCHVFGYGDKSPASRQGGQPLSREKKKNSCLPNWGESMRNVFMTILKQSKLIAEQKFFFILYCLMP